MSNPNNKTEKEQVLEFIRLCFRHWYYFIISGVIVGIIGIIYLKIATPVFAINAQVAMRHDESLGGSVNKGQSSGLLSAMGFGKGVESIEDESITMSSQGNIKEVVKILDLNKQYWQIQCMGLNKTNLSDQSPILLEVEPYRADTISRVLSFGVSVQKDGTAKVKVKMGRKKLGTYSVRSFPATISTVFGDFTLAPSAQFAEYEAPYRIKVVYFSYDCITQIYREKINIMFYKKTSDIIDLSLKESDPEWAKKILNTAINVYNQRWDDDKEFVYLKRIEYVDNRLNSTSVELSETDKQIQRFKDQYNLTDIEADVKYYFSVSAGIQETMLKIETSIAGLDILLDFLQDEVNRYEMLPFSLSSDNAGISKMTSDYNTTIIRYNELRKANTPTAFLHSVGEQLDAYRKNLITSIRKEKESQQNALMAVKKKENELNKKIGNVPVVERDFIKLKRNQELQQSIYVFLLEKKEELSIQAVSLMPKLKVIESPYVLNDLVSPSLMKVALIVLFFGGAFFPLLLIYGLPYIRTFKKQK